MADGEGAQGVAMEPEPQTSPDDVKNTIVTFLTAEFVPNDEGGYQRSIYDVMKAAYTDVQQQNEFKTKVAELQAYLAGKGFHPLSTDILTHVPASAVPEFHVAPWQLSYDPAVSVKGSQGTLYVTLCRVNGKLAQICALSRLSGCLPPLIPEVWLFISSVGVEP